MPYYSGDYYRGGDNYQRGDFLGIGKAVKKLAGNLIGQIPVVGAIAKTLIPSIGGGRQISISPPPGPRPEPGITGMAHRAFAGGESGFLPRRRINYGNMKALRRASRRAHGFLNAVKGAVRYFVPKQPKGRAYVAFKKRKK